MSRHRAPRRPIRNRGRAGTLAATLGVTLVIGGTAVGVVPQLTAGEATASASGVSSLETVRLVQAVAPVAPAITPAVVRTAAPAVPADSGKGRRIVFDQSDQRVWLVRGDNTVKRTYRVSGSRFDNLDPGSYAVQSKTRYATAFDYSGTMEYFVRFATGYSEPIGFHTVPRDNDGKVEQTKSQLGTPLSAGCVRQWEPDAIALWDFAPIGTPVTVTR